MKNQLKTKMESFKNVIIQDESGLDTFKVRKETFLALLASRLREIAAERTMIKAHLLN